MEYKKGINENVANLILEVSELIMKKGNRLELFEYTRKIELPEKYCNTCKQSSPHIPLPDKSIQCVVCKVIKYEQNGLF